MNLVELLKKAVNEGASDIYFVTGEPPNVRIRGATASIQGAPVLRAEDVRAIVKSVVGEAALKQFDEDLELDTSFGIPDVARFRMNVFRRTSSVGVGPGICMRTIPTTLPTCQELGLSEKMESLADLKRGLVLVTGPTGSGKTTTLAAILNKINLNYNKTIVTVEDPVEFVYPKAKSLVIQRGVGAETKSFSEALRRALRQAPDVILIGEMRDTETVHMALTAAETGHLCFGTLHTQDAAGTVDRIIGIFPHEQQNQVRIEVCNALKAVISQQLAVTADGKGRVAAREFMIMTTAINTHIREGKPYMIASEIQTGAREGMVTMDQALANLVGAGKITEAEAMFKAYDKTSVSAMIAEVMSRQQIAGAQAASAAAAAPAPPAPAAGDPNAGMFDPLDPNALPPMGQGG